MVSIKIRRREFLKGFFSGIILGATILASLAYGFPRSLKIPGPTTIRTVTKTKSTTITEFKTETITRTVTRTETKTIIAPTTPAITETTSTYTTAFEMSIPEEFKQLATSIPGAVRFNPVIDNGKIIYYEVYDSRNILIAYAFKVRVVTCPDVIIVLGIVDLDYRVIDIDVKPSEDLPWGYPTWWTRAVDSRDFEDEFHGLSIQELYLDRDGGRVHAISGATLSSKAITEAIRKKIETIISGRDHFDTYKLPQPCPTPMG
jgi:electron transport complex protein RnfG